jgi:uncharacterized protein (DUF58 family)
VFAAGGVATVVVGRVLGYDAVVVLGATALLVAGVALVWCLVPLRLIVTRLVEPGRIPRGSRARDQLTIRTTAKIHPPVQLLDAVADRQVIHRLGWLRRSVPTVIESELSLSRRGTVVLGPLDVVRRDPFGLWARRSRIVDTAEVLVVPRVYPLRRLHVGSLRDTDADTERPLTGSSQFASLREYVLGDDVRRVHWRTSARVGVPVVAEYVDTAVPVTVVVLDVRLAVYGEQDLAEEAADVAASLGEAAIRRGERLVVRTTDGGVLDTHGSRRPEGAAATWLALRADVADEDRLEYACSTAQIPERPNLIVVTGTGGSDLVRRSAPLVRAASAVALCVVGAAGDARLDLPVPSGARVVTGADAPAVLAAWDAHRGAA